MRAVHQGAVHGTRLYNQRSTFLHFAQTGPNTLLLVLLPTLRSLLAIPDPDDIFLLLFLHLIIRLYTMFDYGLWSRHYNNDQRLLLILLMSILLIGQRNRYYSTQKPKFADIEEVEEHKRTKKTIQDQYRRELIEQMQESNERKRKQREKEKEIDLKYEKVFYDQIAEYQRRLQTQHPNEGFMNKADAQQIGISYHSVKPIRKQHELTLPPVHKQTQQKKTKFSRLQTQPNHYYSFHAKPMERLHTDYQKYDDYQPKYEERLQSVQIRQKKLQQQLQSKLKEVYDLMAHSVKSFNESQELQRIGSKLSPIKLNLEKQYKVKYAQPKVQIYNEEPQDYYKLPNITHGFKQETFTTPVTQNNPPSPIYESEAQWRQWYAKEKLRELQVRYKKQLDLQASQIKSYNRRAPTPKFRNQTNQH